MHDREVPTLKFKAKPCPERYHSQSYLFKTLLFVELVPDNLAYHRQVHMRHELGNAPNSVNGCNVLTNCLVSVTPEHIPSRVDLPGPVSEVLFVLAQTALGSGSALGPSAAQLL